VLLPATQQDAAAPPPAPADAVGGHGETILVVEDEDGIRDVARRILKRHGYRVRAAAGGPEAIELLAAIAEPIDLLLTDAVMPGMLGKALAGEVAARRPGTRVLYMSGYAAPMLGFGASVPVGMHLIEKPFTEDALLTAVRAALTSQTAIEAPD
jgi:DNA-binding NtrC family response regulator